MGFKLIEISNIPIKQLAVLGDLIAKKGSAS
jgi:hypothetical protein